MAYDKKTFISNVTILVDTREQKNTHILAALDEMKVKHISRKLDFGDYSFQIGDRDFSLSCVLERKGSVDEFYGNITTDRERIEKEFAAASQLGSQLILLIEGCPDMNALQEYKMPDWQMRNNKRKVQDIGEFCYVAIKSWECSNRYNFRTILAEDPQDTAVFILENFYWYWRNYKMLIASRRNRAVT